MTTQPNLLVHADALDACSRLPADVRFDLVYVDPPFGVGTTMTARTKVGEARGRKHRASGPDAYDDRAKADELVALLAPRFSAIRGRMAHAATLVVHLDHRAVHEAKIALDEVFGRGAFMGEIIWVPGNGSRGAAFSVTHQTLLLYARAASERPEAAFRPDDPILREPYADTSLAMHFKLRDEDGRRYRERVIGGKAYRYYADVGRRMGSVWTDIPSMNANTPLRKESTGYPTQKPEKLLERIVKVFSKDDAVVADLMCGSGTTLVAAVGSSRVDLQACKLEYSIVSPK